MPIIPILSYHNISEKPEDNLWCITRDQFKEQISFILENNIKTLTLADYYSYIKKPQGIPKNSVIITFDDARDGVFKYAYPIIKKHKLNAVLFVVSDWINKKNIPPDEAYSNFLTWEQIEELSSNGFEIASHSKTHRNLTTLTKDELADELISSKREITLRVKKEPISFAYPYGNYNEIVKALVSKNYKIAVTTSRLIKNNILELPRRIVTKNTTLEEFKTLLSKNTLSLCMITKNEQNNISRCLKRVLPILDEIIIVDTGSTDKTKEIAKSYGALVIEANWENDFSKIRNTSIRKAKGDYILILDPDELIARSDLFKLRSLIDRDEKNKTAYSFITRNYTDDDKVAGFKPNKDNYGEGKLFLGYFPSKKVRLFPNKKEIFFEGAIHELVENSIKNLGLKIIDVEIPIHHYHIDSEKKHLLYLELAKKKLEKEKNHIAYYELGIQYKELGYYEDAIDSLKQSIRLKPTPLAFYNLGVVYENLKDYENAEKFYRKTLSLSPGFSHAYFSLGVCLLKENRLKEAEDCFLKSIRLNKSLVSAYNNLGAVYEKLGDYKKAISIIKEGIRIKETPTGFFNLAVNLDKQGNYSEALEAYKKALFLNHKRKDDIKKRISEIKSFIHY